MLENAAVYSLLKDNIEEYETFMIQLRGFYNDTTKVLPASEKKYGLIGLYLLFLIYKNRAADYYTEIETLTIEEQKNIYISVAVNLEQYFVDGNYFKILQTKQNVPLQIYNFFIDKMIETVREESARSAEKAYGRLRLEDAYKIFLLGNVEELKIFAQKEKNFGIENNVAWIIKGEFLYFEPIHKEILSIPSEQVINKSFEFTRELEKII